MYLMKMLDILVVEDDEVSILGLKRTFRTQNLPHQLSFTRNAEEALEQLKTAPEKLPTLILLDLNIPGKGGMEFLRKLRSQEQLASIPVYIFTASESENDRISAFQFNVAGYIRKPTTLADYASTVSALSKYWELIEFAS